jgi:phosphatidate cytidylyltransferase
MFKNLDKERITTGAALVAVIMIVAWVDSFIVTWLFLGVAFLFSFYEAMKLFGVEDNSLYFYALALWLFAAIYPNPDDLIFVVLIVQISWMIYQGKPDFKKIQPFAYPAAPFLFLLALYTGFGIEALIWLVLVVALTDTGAYFVGRAMGKRKFCEGSPKKTWEGVIGGVAVATIAGTFYGTGFVSGYLAFVISLVVAFTSIFGDLFESYLKRNAGVKDSGAVLPGHGGVLDRVDGYMFAGIMMVVLLRGLA